MPISSQHWCPARFLRHGITGLARLPSGPVIRASHLSRALARGCWSACIAEVRSGHLDGRDVFTTAKDVQVQSFPAPLLMPVQQLQQLCVALPIERRRQVSCVDLLDLYGGFTGSSGVGVIFCLQHGSCSAAWCRPAADAVAGSFARCCSAEAAPWQACRCCLQYVHESCTVSAADQLHSWCQGCSPALQATIYNVTAHSNLKNDRIWCLYDCATATQSVYSSADVKHVGGLQAMPLFCPGTEHQITADPHLAPDALPYEIGTL